jgi:hypothetical protein
MIFTPVPRSRPDEIHAYQFLSPELEHKPNPTVTLPACTDSDATRKSYHMIMKQPLWLLIVIQKRPSSRSRSASHFGKLAWNM